MADECFGGDSLRTKALRKERKMHLLSDQLKLAAIEGLGAVA